MPLPPKLAEPPHLMMSCHLPVRISGYRGDGTISKVHFFLNPGFQVDFEQFSVSSAHKASYKLDGIPKHDDLYQVGVVLLVPLAELGHKPKILDKLQLNVLQLRLIDGLGREIFLCRSLLGEMNWIWTREEFFGTIWSQSPRCISSTFVRSAIGSHPYMPILLELEYEPTADSVDLMAKVRIIAGGSV